MSLLGSGYRPHPGRLESTVNRSGRLVDGPLFSRGRRALGLGVPIAVPAARPAAPRTDDLARRSAEIRDEPTRPAAGRAGGSVVALVGHATSGGVDHGAVVGVGRRPQPEGLRNELVGAP